MRSNLHHINPDRAVAEDLHRKAQLHEAPPKLDAYAIPGADCPGLGEAYAVRVKLLGKASLARA